MKAIYKKEVLSFFRSMMGYLYTAFLLLIAGVFFTAFNLQGGVAEFGYVLGLSLIHISARLKSSTGRSAMRRKTGRSAWNLTTLGSACPGRLPGM